MQKYFTERVQASISCHDGDVHIHTIEGRKSANDRLKDHFLFQNAAFLED